MASIRNLFILETPYQEDKDEFFEFMENNCQICFPPGLNVTFRVPYLMVRSVVNKRKPGQSGAKHRKLWTEFSNALNHIQPNSKYNNFHKAEILKMIYDDAGGSYIKLVNRIDKFIENFATYDFQFNVVKYTSIERFERGGGFF